MLDRTDPEATPATEAQVSFLAKCGVVVPDGTTVAAANILIRKAVA